MGGGQSVQAQEHLRRWEVALQELENISSANRRLIEQDKLFGAGAGGAAAHVAGGAAQVSGDSVVAGDREGRRPSSLVSFNPGGGQQPAGLPAATVFRPGTDAVSDGVVGASTGSLPAAVVVAATATAAAATGRPRSIQSTPETKQVEPRGAGFGFSNVATSGAGAGNSAVGADARSTGSTSAHARHGRQQALEIKAARMTLFKSYEAEQPDEVPNQLECGHFGAVAVALSYLLGGDSACADRRKRVTVEDIFFTAQVPLHYLHTGPPHLPVMSDIVREVLDVDNRFRGEYGQETVHLDIQPTVGQVDLGPNEVGDRQTRMELPEFQRVIMQDCEEETHVIRVVNYDPYVLEQGMLVDAYEDEDDLNSPLATSVVGTQHQRQQRREAKSNDGAYAVIVDVRNAVQLMVTIAEGIVGSSLHVRLREVPVSVLFKAMMCAEEDHRARGFIRIFRKDSVPDFTTDEVKQFWTPELCSGKVLGTIEYGTQASVISHHISPHIVGVAWAMHLLAGVREGTHGYGNGLPVSDIIRSMKFPSSVFLDGDLPLEQVYEYAVEYMKRTGRNHVASLYPVLTNISRSDAPPTISVFDLETVLMDVKDANKDPETPEHVMLIQYNANVAHNVLYIADHLQWCVLCGYDPETQTVMCLDAHPKTFSRTWCCSLDRLQKAMTGTGYIVFSKTSPIAPSTKDRGEHMVGAPLRPSSLVESRLQLLKKQKEWGFTWGDDASPAAQGGVPRFAYPSIPLMPTVIAMACSRLGSLVTFEDVIHTLPFETSTLIIRFFTLESLHVCLTQYLKFSRKDDEIQVAVHHGDHDTEGNPFLSLQKFTSLVEEATAGPNAKDTVLVVDFHPSMLLVHGAANPFGCLGIVLSYDREGGHVKVVDSNPNGYLSTWSVPIEVLYNACVDSDESAKHRTRGCLVLTKGAVSAPDAMPEGHNRDFKLELLPVQNVFHVSPSPHFQGMSFAFSQLGCYYSPEEIFYEAYLKTVSDQRRRGSQAFAWRDVDVSLSVISRNVDAPFMAQVCRMFLDSRASGNSKSAHAACTGKHMSVELIDDIDDVEELLEEATSATDSVLLINYDTTKVHHVPNIGRSVALIKGFDRKRRLVELWDAEYTVLGLAFTVTVEQLVEMGDLEADGRSIYGLVRFAWKDEPAPKKRGLMAAPKSAEEEAEMDAAVTSARRRQGGQTTFVKGKR